MCVQCVYSYLHTRLIGSDVEGGRERRSHVRYGGDAAVAEKSPDSVAEVRVGANRGRGWGNGIPVRRGTHVRL